MKNVTAQANPSPLPSPLRKGRGRNEASPSAKRRRSVSEVSSKQGDLLDYEELFQPVNYGFGLKRRSFVQILGAGLLIAASVPALGQQRRGRGGGFGGSGAKNIGARIHLGKDGSITVLVVKGEGGQGARAELTQAAAEELRVPASSLQLIMADTALVPDDGMTAGSGSSPRTVPAVRQGAAAARQLLVDFACRKWSVEAGSCEAR